MDFSRVNKYTVCCKFQEEDLAQMGYEWKTILKDRSIAQKFLQDVLNRARQAGYPIEGTSLTIQTVAMPNHQLELRITSVGVDDQINWMIETYLGISDSVDALGIDRLERILELTGEEKVQAFDACMADLKKMQEEQAEEEAGENDMAGLPDIMGDAMSSGTTQDEVQTVYSDEGGINIDQVDSVLLNFQNLDSVQRFCKVAPSVPGKLYKDQNGYWLLSDLSQAEQSIYQVFAVDAYEYANNIEEGSLRSAYLNEQGNVIIKENAMEIMKNL